jgi:hypothetical protein
VKERTQAGRGAEERDLDLEDAVVEVDQEEKEGAQAAQAAAACGARPCASSAWFSVAAAR